MPEEAKTAEDNSHGGRWPHHRSFIIISKARTPSSIVSSIIIIIIKSATATTKSVSQAKPRSHFRGSSKQITDTKDSPRGSSGAKGGGEGCFHPEEDKERAEEEGH